MPNASSSRSQTVLETRGLEVGYRGKPLLPSLDFEVKSGELWCICGPNGAGKTTVLRTLLGLLPPVGGELEWTRPRVAYVAQRSALDQSLPARVIDVVKSGLDRGLSVLNPLYGMGKKKAVLRALRDADARDLAQERFANLSEGQKQRVLIARALAANPQALVLDEPTSAMDVRAERAIMDLLDHLRSHDLAVIVVSHHLEVATSYATHLMLVDRERRVAMGGPTAKVGASGEWKTVFGELRSPGDRP